MLSSFCLFTQVYQSTPPRQKNENERKSQIIYSLFPEIFIECLSCFPGSSVGKESACNAGDPSLIPGSERSAGEGLGYPVFLGFPGGSDSEESACNAGDLGSVPGLGRFPGAGKGYPLQYSCLENPHGQRCLAGYSPWDHKESDTIEWLSTHTLFQILFVGFGVNCE